MSLRAILWFILLFPASAAAQTNSFDIKIPLPEVSEYERARIDMDRLIEPGGENADAFYAAKRRAEALEAEGAWADALEEWERASVAVEKALQLAEFGTSPMTLGLPPAQFTMQMPQGFHHRQEVRNSASRAAHRAGDAAAAMRWADNDSETIAKFEAEARAQGLEELADEYRIALLGQELNALGSQLSTHYRRTGKRLVLLGLYELMLLLIGGALLVRHFRRRPRFTYLQPGRHRRAVPEPRDDWGPSIAAAVGGLFGLAVVARLLVATWDHATRDSGVVLLIVSVLATGLVLWVFIVAITRTPRARRRLPRALQDLDAVKTENLGELRSWFDANVRAVCADFGVGPLPRGRLDRTVPAVSDPMLRSAVAGWLGEQLARRSRPIPEFLDEHVAASIAVYPAGAWEPFVATYVRALDATRRDALLSEVPRGASVVLGGPVLDPHHTGPVAVWLELAMVHGVRWSARSWHARFAEPTLRDIASSVVWGVYDADELVRSMRFDAEGGLVALGYESVDVDSLMGCEIGVVHCVELAEGDRRAWEQELADFETVALFDQFGRPPTRPAWNRRVEGARLDVQVYLADGALERLLDSGWERCAVGLHRALIPFGITAQVHIDGTTCQAIYFYLGYHTAYQGGTAIEPDRVSDIAVSEVLYELKCVRDHEPPE